MGAKATHVQMPNYLKSLRAKIEIAARHQLMPYQQGALDSLCTIYAVTNALRLALADIAPLSKARCKQLFAAGAEHLDLKMGFAIAAMSGVGTKRRLMLARHLAQLVSTSKFTVVIERPEHRSSWTSIDGAISWIALSLIDGKPVLLTLQGGMNHFTVVTGMTPATLLLHDSSGMRFLRKTSLDLRDGFYRVPPNGLLRIAVERSG